MKYFEILTEFQTKAIANFTINHILIFVVVETIFTRDILGE